jgi:hypothetical protein
MFAFLGKDWTGTGADWAQEEDGMSKKTSVVSLAEGPSDDARKGAATIEELANSEKIAACNPSLAGAREVVNK